MSVLSQQNKTSFQNKYPLCIDLLDQFYKDEISTLTKYVKDPFFEDDERLKTLYEWYLEKNPNFMLIDQVNPSMEEYKCLIAGMIKDLLLSSLINNNVINEILSIE